MNEPIAWWNGELIPAVKAALPVHDLGVVAGASVTEMARTFGHRTFRIESHLERLMTSLATLGFPRPFDSTVLAAAVDTVLKVNLSLIATAQDLGIVIFSTAGSNPTYGVRATDSTTAVHTFELPFAMWRSAFTNGVRLRIPNQRQLSADVFPVTRKTRNRLHWWLADQEAAQLEPGSRALLLDGAGRVTETSTSCVFLVLDGSLVTPQQNVLDSLSRRMIQGIADSLGIPFTTRDVWPDELFRASEIMLSSTPACLLPVSHIDGKTIGDGRAGPIFAALIAAWSELVGVDVAKQMTTVR